MTEQRIYHRQLFDLFMIAFLGVIVLALGAFWDLLETLFAFSRQHEDWEIDELSVVIIALVVKHLKLPRVSQPIF